jgi:anti-anti-sigma factor
VTDPKIGSGVPGPSRSLPTARPPQGGRFHVVASRLGGAPAVVVGGEVDVHTSGAFTDALEEAIRGSDGSFVIDLCDVSFLDSRGIHALLRARALLGRNDRRLALVCPSGDVRRVLELVGIEDLFALHDSREDAARALARERGEGARGSRRGVSVLEQCGRAPSSPRR